MCSRRACRGRVPETSVPRRPSRGSGRGVLAPSERRRGRVLASRAQRRGACDEGAVVPASSERRSRPRRRARAERAAVAAPVVRVPCLRRASGRARAPRAAVVCSCRGSRRALAERAAVVCPSSECGRARRPSAAVACPRRSSRVLASIERRPCARDDRAVAPPSRVPRPRRRGVSASRVPPRPSPVCGDVALASSVPSCSRSECRGSVPPSREPSRTSRGSGRPRPRPECRRALDEGAVRWCRGRRVRMVDVPSPSVPH